jgi:hypothetical protein
MIWFTTEVFISANVKAVFTGVLPGLPFLGYRFFAQRVTDIQTAVAHVQALIQALSAASYNYNFHSEQFVNTI